MFSGFLLLLLFLLCGFASPLVLAALLVAWRMPRWRQRAVRSAQAGLAGALLLGAAYLVLGLAFDAEGAKSLLSGLFTAGAGFTVGTLAWLAWTWLRAFLVRRARV